MNKTKTYPSDLSDTEWLLVEPLIPAAKSGGRPRSVDMREIINAIFYVVRSGCAWRMLPHDYPAWSTVYGYFWRWQHSGLWSQINDALREAVRLQAERESEPSAAIIDTQAVKTTQAKGERGFDAGKRVMGRKRHLLVDTLGLVLMVVVHAANIQDQTGAKLVFNKVKGRFPRLQLIWADGIYRGQLVDWLLETCGWILEIVMLEDKSKGFQLLPRRWVVERTFAWLGRFRRLSKDYEQYPATAEAIIYLASIRLMLARLARHPTVAL